MPCSARERRAHADPVDAERIDPFDGHLVDLRVADHDHFAGRLIDDVDGRHAAHQPIDERLGDLG